MSVPSFLFSKPAKVAVAAGALAVLAGCATGPDQRDIQEGVLFINPETDSEQHLADIDACNLARDEENTTGEQAAVAAAGLLLGGLPGLVAIAMMNDEKEATLYNQCMFGKGYEPIKLGGQYADKIVADNGQEDTKELVPTIHAELTDEERQAWKEATLGVDAEMYRTYLTSFPQGIFAEEARVRAENAELIVQEQAELAAFDESAETDENGNRIWKLRGEITDGTYYNSVGFCRTGTQIRGRVRAVEDRVVGEIVDQDGEKYTVSGIKSGDTIVLKHRNQIILRASGSDGSKSGTIYKESTWNQNCDGDVTFS